MASRLAVNGSGAHAGADGAPPPSTLAALVASWQHATGNNEQAKGSAFYELITEIRGNPAALDDDVASNALLITIIVDVGLNHTVSQDPFDNARSLDEQIIACLDVIRIVVKRTPNVLYQAVETSDAQLFFLVFRKLLAICAQDSLKDNLQHTASTLVVALSSRYDRWSSTQTQISMLRKWCDTFVESITLDHSRQPQPFPNDLLLPSAYMTQANAQQVAVAQGPRLVLRTVGHAVAAATLLIDSVLQLDAGNAFGGSTYASMGDQDWLWAHSICRSLSEAMLRRPSVAISSGAHFVLFLIRLAQSDLAPNVARHKLHDLVITTVAGTINLKYEGTETLRRACLRGVNFILAASEGSLRVKQRAESILKPALEQLLQAHGDSSSVDSEILRPIRAALSRLLACHPRTGGTKEARSMNRTQIARETPEEPHSEDLQRDDDQVAERPVKRRRLLIEPPSQPESEQREDLVESICQIFGNWAPANFNGLVKVAPELYADLHFTDQHRVLQLLGDMQCAGQGNINSRADDHRGRLECYQCGSRFSKAPRTLYKPVYTKEQCNAALDIFTSLLECSVVHSSIPLRIKGMHSLRQVAAHNQSGTRLDLSESSAGKSCLSGLRSSNRKIRIGAGHALAMFLRPDIGNDEQLCRKNRVSALNVIRSLAQSKDARICETVIMTLGRIAPVCGEEEMNLILLLLLDCLGNANPYICGLANTELRRVAELSDSSVEALFGPFWGTLAITVVKDLLAKPQKAQQLSDIMGCSVSHLLRLTQIHTVPYLVLWGQLEVLTRVAGAQGSNATTWDVCITSENLTKTLALIMTQHADNAEFAITECLSRINTDFKTTDVDALLKLETIGVAREILRFGGELDMSSREKALKGFSAFTAIVERRGHATRISSATQARMTSLFYENHALGIMTSFSDTIESPLQPVLEKKRCLRAIAIMIESGQGDIAVTLPQIRACLKPALENKELCCEAFDVHSMLLGVAESAELESLICQTFSIIASKFAVFDSATQQKAHNVITALVRDQSALIQEIANFVPSLGSIDLLSKFETQLANLRNEATVSSRLKAFVSRCADDSEPLVVGALQELLPYLEENQQRVHDASEVPAPVVAELVRSLLEACARFTEVEHSISELCGKCLGVIGCLDTNRVENVREQNDTPIMLSNFGQASEAIDFVVFILERVLTKAFLGVSNPRAQGFLAFAMQELLKFCGFNKDVRSYRTQADELHQRWLKFSDPIRSILTPFLSSRYVLTTAMNSPGLAKKYPLYSVRKSHGTWIREFAIDALQHGNGTYGKIIFNVLARVVRGYDVQIASFLLPYAAANIIIDGQASERRMIVDELSVVLKQPMHGLSQSSLETLKHCSETVFMILDYVARYLQEKRKTLAVSRNLAERSGRPMDSNEEAKAEQQIINTQCIFTVIPADVIAKRAVECRSYARAIRHLEEHRRNLRYGDASTHSSEEQQALMYQDLHMIYSKIDEPDGIEGVANYIQLLSPEQQALEHRRAGRWSAAQSWYDLQLRENPSDLQMHAKLLSCFQDAAQFPSIIKHATSAQESIKQDSGLIGMVARAAWSAQDWATMDMFVSPKDKHVASNFDVGVGTAIQALRQRDSRRFLSIIDTTRAHTVKIMTGSSIESLSACRDQLLKLHVLYEMQLLGAESNNAMFDAGRLDSILERRLQVLGNAIPDKQYILGIRRAIMQAQGTIDDSRLASSWMTSVRLARKALPSSLAYDALFHASKLGDESSKIEHAKLFWNEGSHQKAIKSLEGAIGAKTFAASNDVRMSGATSLSTSAISTTSTTHTAGEKPQQNLLVARAHLLLAKWLDRAGQTQWDDTLTRYRQATISYGRWEKSVYWLGKFYCKLHDSDKTLPLAKQSVRFLSGETTKLVVENYLRSLQFGCKYIFETLPKLLTLWLDLGEQVDRKISQGIPDDVRNKVIESRKKIMDAVNKQVNKYAERIQAYIFYTALPQMITRITHPNAKVWETLSRIIVKVVTAYPQQALWSLLAVTKAKEFNRSRKGAELLTRLKERGNKIVRNEGQSVDLRELVAQGQRMSDELLHACEVPIEGRVTMVSLTKTLHFKLKAAPCALVIPLEKTLFASLPVVHSVSSLRNHKPFPATREAITIKSLEDAVLILASLQKPRKLTINGSDGHKYGLLCKPNDDLRKDQRLMEFNAMINRGLKSDAASSSRRLYVKTYAVTPLNEACGLIEWVEGLKPLRDILLALYKSKGTKVDYALLKELLTDACRNPPESTKIFSETILTMYRPLLHEWFTELFPVPDAWYAARTRYARSCAVASMVGHALGLGDRHGENVLLEEKTGGVFHVDFNCLFDKGLTFEKPELVPFRLTHNMVDAMGATGVEGAFRRAAECAMGVMREQEDALLTILETFVYDPTADFVGSRRKIVKGVPDSPMEVLESVRDKVRGLMMGESLALSVQGHVDALIRQARDPARLAAMYIGWCAFL